MVSQKLYEFPVQMVFVKDEDLNLPQPRQETKKQWIRLSNVFALQETYYQTNADSSEDEPVTKIWDRSGDEYVIPIGFDEISLLFEEEGFTKLNSFIDKDYPDQRLWITSWDVTSLVETYLNEECTIPGIELRIGDRSFLINEPVTKILSKIN